MERCTQGMDIKQIKNPGDGKSLIYKRGGASNLLNQTLPKPSKMFSSELDDSHIIQILHRYFVQNIAFVICL